MLGFRKKTAINYLAENITSTVENKQYLVALFLDLSKAFDTMNHETLLHKL
ncbi:hypothetical protein CAPTEDRAFT_69596, partial [Capitella teleta]